MFPNPQDALCPGPSAGLYREMAEGLARACRDGDLGPWGKRWAGTLGKSIAKVTEFARREFGDGCEAGTAELVIARSHGFAGWALFVEHLEGLAAGTEVAAFEAAVDAIVDGDEKGLARLLGDHPELVHATSLREHGATLLIYSSANGVENYRQRTPVNIVRIAEMLLDAGADVEATARVYGGDCSTLGLAATSAHPRQANVQIPLLELLLARGARMKDGSGGGSHGVVFACIVNGCPEAAAWLAERGARVGLVEEAVLGRLEEVRKHLAGPAAPVNEALRWACAYGRTAVAELLIGHGADLSDAPGDGQTATHQAVICGRLDTLKMLLAHRPPLEQKNVYGGTVLGQALWSAAHGQPPDLSIRIIEALLDGGAALPERHVPVNERVDAFLASLGSRPEPSWHWYGEEPARGS
jgi:hypothetical protein